MLKNRRNVRMLLAPLALVLVVTTAFGAARFRAAATGEDALTDPATLPPVSGVPAGPPVPVRPISRLVPYAGPVEHIFFHPLIAYPERAFDQDHMSRGYYDWFVTVKEFERVIASLYARDYILVEIDSLYETKLENGKPVLAQRELLLPEGKKPLVLSIDDMNYYEYMRENGNVYRLVLDGQGAVATESVNLKGETVRRYDDEIVPILDAFVATHPDFSHDGAKGVIALTGYEGILGYRTDQMTAPAYEQEKQQALEVVQRLKETGWSFAAHGWGHQDAAKVSQNTFVQDTLRWKAEVEPLIGPTPVYIYPFGSQVLPGDPKFQFLLAQGFQLLCSVGPKPYFEVTPDFIRMDRRHIDGMALHDQRSLLLDLFDANEVIDPIRPAIY